MAADWYPRAAAAIGARELSSFSLREDVERRPERARGPPAVIAQYCAADDVDGHAELKRD
jgi:hypothetical protein